MRWVLYRKIPLIYLYEILHFGTTALPNNVQEISCLKQMNKILISRGSRHTTEV